MTLLDWLLAIFCIFATSLHLLTTALALCRCRRGTTQPAPPERAPAVSILRPIRGVDSYDELTLRSSFKLDYPNFELIFCCADETDPATLLVRRLMACYPDVKAELLVGRDYISDNPKLNNLVKGWRQTRRDWVIFADSNVFMPHDYVQRLLAGWRADTGILCSPPIGSLPLGFWAEVECACLNTYQARWQYAADSAGFGFAQGKTMLWRKCDLARAGGIGALAAEIAEDAAATKVVRRLGLRARLVDAPFAQPLGRRSARQVWDRQARWSRLRRITFPALFVPEALTGSILPIVAGACVADALGLPAPAIAALLSLIWFGSEAVLARVAGWHLAWRSPVAWAVRDAMLAALWMQAWLGDGFEWRGNDVRVDAGKMQAT